MKKNNTFNYLLALFVLLPSIITTQAASWASAGNIIAHLNPKNLTWNRATKTVASVTAGAGALKMYQAVRTKRATAHALAVNKPVIEQVKNSPQQKRVICFDLHYVVAEFNIKRMLWTALKNPSCLKLLLYPRMIPTIIRAISQDRGSQAVLEAAQEQYPEARERTQHLYSLGMEISAQLTPIQGTIDLAQKLMAQGHKVIFVSNIETDGWKLFIRDFPMFAACPRYVVGHENGWLKKPSKEYFQDFLEKSVKLGYRATDERPLFVDDKPENCRAAQETNQMDAIIFSSPEQLVQDFAAMGITVK